MSGPGAEVGRVVVARLTIHDADTRELLITDSAPITLLLSDDATTIPTLVDALRGRKAGERVEVTVPWEEGPFGAAGNEPVPVPRRELGRQGRHLAPGDPVELRDSAGKPRVLWVHAVRGRRVWLGNAHPHGGRNLAYTVDILRVRDATAGELAHGHIHGVDGDELHP